MELSAVLVWGKLIVACALTYYVWKDSVKNNVPYSNAWICLTFIFFPVVLLYFYYKYHLKKKRSRPAIWQREMELHKKHEEEQQKLRKEMLAWKAAKKQEMALNKLTEEELALAERKRAEEREARLKELAEERKLQEELNAKKLHLS